MSFNTRVQIAFVFVSFLLEKDLSRDATFAIEEIRSIIKM